MKDAIKLLARIHSGYVVPMEDLRTREVRWLNDEGFVRYTMTGIEITHLGATRAQQYQNRLSGRKGIAPSAANAIN